MFDIVLMYKDVDIDVIWLWRNFNRFANFVGHPKAKNFYLLGVRYYSCFPLTCMFT